jgi:geranylgeranyl diphosphate synthase type II
MHGEKHYREWIEKELSALKLDRHPERLYEPIRYMISLGGKRFRPVLLLMSNELFNGNPQDVIGLALGIEVFHNFTLLHDDIMDKAPLRRSKETVHSKWNPDIAILSGDTMFVQSCMLMMKVKPEYLQDVLNIFFQTAIEVCEGQQNDMDFESANDVSIEDYIHMISQKTAALIACSAFIGAKCAGASRKDCDLMYDFGKNLGLAFQLHDDILDVYGDKDKFGKQVGGDIISNKKTFLLLSALNDADKDLRNDLNQWIASTSFDPQEKVSEVIKIYDRLNIREKTTEKMMSFFSAASKDIQSVNAPEVNKGALLELTERLMVRER